MFSECCKRFFVQKYGSRWLTIVIGLMGSANLMIFRRHPCWSLIITYIFNATLQPGEEGGSRNAEKYVMRGLLTRPSSTSKQQPRYQEAATWFWWPPDNKVQEDKVKVQQYIKYWSPWPHLVSMYFGLHNAQRAGIRVQLQITTFCPEARHEILFALCHKSRNSFLKRAKMVFLRVISK